MAKKKAGKKGSKKKKAGAAAKKKKEVVEDTGPPLPVKSEAEILAENLAAASCHLRILHKVARGEPDMRATTLCSDNFTVDRHHHTTLGDIAREAAERMHLLPSDVSIHLEFEDIGVAERELDMDIGVAERELDMDDSLLDIGLEGGTMEEPTEVVLYVHAPEAIPVKRGSFYTLDFLL